MLSLSDMMLNAQNSEIPQQLQKQFQLNAEQADKVVQALMPAFSRGLKENTADPMGFAGFMKALSSGQHAQYMDNPAAAFTPQGMQEGNGILGHLFGNKDVSRAVADQASQLTGLSQSLIKQILPALAPILMGGLFKQMTGQMDNQAQTKADHQASTANPMGNNPLNNPLGQIFEQMMGAGQQAGGQASQAENPFGPLGQIFEQMSGGFAGQNAPGNPSSSGGGNFDNPLGQIFQDMMKGGIPGMAPRAGDPTSNDGSGDTTGQGSAPGNAMPGGGLGDLFGEMFEAGRDVQDNYKKNVDGIFDEFLKGMIRNK